MKFLIVFALALAAIASASPFNGEIFSREPIVPVVENKNEGRIANGENAAVGQFPYQVGLSLKLSALSSAWCGGSLIGSDWVLTAAHCTDGVESVTVYLGATIRTSAEITVTVSSSDIIIHSDWNSSNLLNDISLIKIPTVSFSSKVQPVPLPKISNVYSTYTAEYVIASGWGRMGDSATTVANDLQWGRMQVISNTVCALTYGSVVAPGNICTSTSNLVSTCKGDSGGPLVLESSGVQIGLTSYGAAAGCEKGYPVAFTRLTVYLDWIKAHSGISY